MMMVGRFLRNSGCCAALAALLMGCSGGAKGSSASGGSAGITGSGGSGTGGGSAAGGSATGGSATGGNGGGFPAGGYGNGPAPGSCSAVLSDRVRITETDVGVAYAYNEVDNNGPRLGLTPLMISP